MSTYQTRKIASVTDLHLVSTSLAAGRHVLLLGHRGTGKSSLAQAAADHLRLPLTSIPCHSGATAEQLLGQWVPDPGGKGFRWMDGLITLAVREGHVLLLDEVNALRPEIAFVIHGLLDHRRSLTLLDCPGDDGHPTVLAAHPKFSVVATANPGYAGTTELNPALRDRFSVQVRLTASARLDEALLQSSEAATRLNGYTLQALVAFVHRLRHLEQVSAVAEPVSTRAVLDLTWNLAQFGFPVGRQLFLTAVEDPHAQASIRSLFRDLWEKDGTPRPLPDLGTSPMAPAPDDVDVVSLAVEGA